MRSRVISRISNGQYVQHEEVEDRGNIEEMGRLGVSPAAHGGDTYYFAGKGTLAKQFEGAEDQLNFIVARAKRNGYTPGINDVYQGELARYPGDPAAFVPPSGGINHIKQVCEDRDLECDGAFKRKRVRRDPNPEKPYIDKKLYKQLAKQVVAQDKSLQGKSKGEIKEAVYDKHAYKFGDT